MLLKDPMLRVPASLALIGDLLEAKAALDRSKVRPRRQVDALNALIVQISSARSLAERQQAVAAGDHVEGA